LYDATVSYTCRGNCGQRIAGEKAVVVWLVPLDMETRCKDVALESFPELPGWNRESYLQRAPFLSWSEFYWCAVSDLQYVRADLELIFVTLSAS